MKFIFGYKRQRQKGTVKIYTNMKTLDMLLLLTSQSDMIASNIAKEKGIEKTQAIEFLKECISEVEKILEKDKE